MNSHDSGQLALLDQLAEEFADRYRRGDRPSLKEYIDRYPDLADDIREVFPALAGIEQIDEDRREPSDQSTPLPKQIGDFRLLREIGRGGMGVVYEAEQVSLGRRVALKVLPSIAVKDAKALERFRREARAAARLHHTNIVPVFEVGQEGDSCFYAMQLIQGQGLDLVVEELRRLRAASPVGRKRLDAVPRTQALPEVSQAARSLLTGHFSLGNATLAQEDIAHDGVPAAPTAAASAVLPGQAQFSSVESDRRHYFESVARIGQQAAGALVYAHQRGVLHRDIKPSNLLLDGSGVVWVTDFGLAKTDEDGLTRTGDILGTFRYMAPERFQGASDARSDVYALGLTLYELLTLRPGFDAPDRLRVMELVKESEPPTPRSLDSRIPRDLETIVLTAIAKDPKRRYQTAEAMSEDLHRFLAGEPIKARRTSQLERGWLWCRRHPAVASLLGVIAAMILVVIVGVIVKNAELSRALKDSKEANEAADVRLWESLHDRARAMRMSGRPGQRLESLKSIREAMELPLPPGHSLDELRTEAIAALALPDLEKIREWEGFPDGTMAGTVDPTVTCYARATKEGVVSVRAVADDHELFHWTEEGFAPFPGGQHCFVLGPGGRFLAITQGDGGKLRVRRLEGEMAVLCHEAEAAVIHDFSPNGKLLLYSKKAENGVVLNLETGDRRKLDLTPSISWLRFSPDSRRIAGCILTPGKWALEVRDLESGNVAATVPLPERPQVCAWHPNGKWLAVYCLDNIVRLLEVPSGRLVRIFEHGISLGCRLAFDATGELMFSNGWGGPLKVWQLSSGQQLLSQSADGYGFLTCGPHGEISAVSPMDSRRLQVFRVHQTSLLRTWMRPTHRPDGSFHAGLGRQLFTPDGRLLLSVVADYKKNYGIAVLDAEQGEELANLDVPHHELLKRTLDGSLLTYCQAGLLRWPLHTAQEQSRRYHLGPPQRLFQHPLAEWVGVDEAERIFAFPMFNQGAIRWRPEEPDKLLRLQPQQDVRSCAVSPDGRWIATGSHSCNDGLSVKIWDAATGKLVKALPVPASCQVQFSPDGRWLYTSSGGRLWHTESWDEARAVGGFHARFAPVGQLLAVEAEGGAVRLVALDDDREVVRLEGPDHNRVIPSCFSPDGTRLVTFGIDWHSLQVWDLRALRAELATLGLDWEAPPYPPAPQSANHHAPEVTVDLGNLKGFAEADRLLRVGNRHWNAKEYGKAIESLRQAVQKDAENAEANNNLAWFLLTGPKELRDAKTALPFARKAVDLSPRRYLFHNTLGVALYRNGQPAEAIPVLELSLQNGGGESDAFDLLFLAMCHHDLGHADKAKECQERAVRWFKEHRASLPASYVEELTAFQAEAEETLRK
jgi:serine/threonine protein kinase/WD40 repeat protein